MQLMQQAKKMSVLCLGFFFIASLGAGCSASTGTSGNMPAAPSGANPTTDTSTTGTIKTITYENNMVGFSLEHPSDWRVDESVTGTVNFFYAGTGGEPAVAVERIEKSREKAVQSRVAELKKFGSTPVQKNVTRDGVEVQSLCLAATAGNFCEFYFAKSSVITIKVSDYTTDQVSKTFKVLP
jgi:hypothetical protein